MNPRVTNKYRLKGYLDGIDQAQCDAMGARLAEISAAVDRTARMVQADGAPGPYDRVPLDFTKFFTIIAAVAGGDLDSKTVLDVGCGGGGFMSQALGLGMIPTGIDIYSGQAHGRNAAEQLLAAAGMTTEEIAMRVLDADITEPLGSLTGQFDLVASSGMLEHIPDEPERIEAVSNMVRALKPGGTLVLLCAPNSRLPVDLFHCGPRYPFYHQLPDAVKRIYMRRVIQPRRPDINDVQSEPRFLNGVPVREILGAIRAVDPRAEIVQAFPLMMRLAVSRSWLRKRGAQLVIGAISRLMVLLKIEPVILIVATRFRA